MLGLTANIGKLVTLLVSVPVSGVGVLVLVLWTTICCIHQKVTISIMLLIAVYRDAGGLDNSGKGRGQLKKNVFFWALPKFPNPPPLDPNSGNLVLFFRTSKFKI